MSRGYLLRALALVGCLSLGLSVAGTGATTAQGQPVPRVVLALYDSSEAPAGAALLPTRTNLIHRLAETPLNYLGLRVQYLDVDTEPLPSENEMRSYLGVITWFQDGELHDATAYLAWLRRQIADGRRVVVLGQIGAVIDRQTRQEVAEADLIATYAAMGLRYTPNMDSDNPMVLSVRRKVPEMVELERTLDDELAFYLRLQSVAPNNRVYLTINRSDLLNGDSDVVVTGPWGGFALTTYEYYEQPRVLLSKWRINPFTFFEEAFGLQGMPRPDVSTLNGSRVFYTHVDGDGFNNVSELDYSSLSSEILLQRFIRRYDLPFTISIVVNDIDPVMSGGPRALRVAREIFAQPNVEPASHTYTHPFDWSQPVNTEHEIRDALDFLNEHSVSAGKPVKLVLWSGATNPREVHVQAANDAGLFHINGGDGRFDAVADSYSQLAPLTTQVNRQTQYYTSNTNDNIYGNKWTGPFYGLRNVIATWDNTESPRRIGAINVYYHIFTAEKHAAVKALEAVYDNALQRDIAPVFTTEYLQFVQGFLSTELSREGDDGWRLRNYGSLRTIRYDNETRFPDLARSTNVIGFRHYQGSLYVYLGEASESTIILGPSAPTQPYVALASHQVLDWRPDGSGTSLALAGVGRMKVVIGGLSADTDYELVQTDGGEQRLRLRSAADGTITWQTEGKNHVRLALRRG